MKNIAQIFGATVVALMTVCAFGETITPANYGKTVTISLSDDAKTALGDETLTDFPVLVRLSTSIENFSYADFKGENGSDLRFALEDGTLLSSEIDTWDETGTSLVWVKVPSLAAATKIVAYYGSAEPDAMTPRDTWSAYAGVWHLNETDAGAVTVVDASGNSDGTSHANSLVMDGVFGKARGRTDATGQGGVTMTAPVSTALDNLTPNFTVSGWMYPTTTSEVWAYVFSRKNADTSQSWGWQFRASDNLNSVGIYSSGTADDDNNRNVFSTSGMFVANTWAKYNVVYTETQVSLYVNGDLVETQTIKPTGGAVSGSLPFAVGGLNNSGNSPGYGTMKCYFDETRLRAGAVDATWVAFAYAQETDSAYWICSAAMAVDATAVKFDGGARVTRDGDAFKVSVTTTSDTGTGALTVKYGTLDAYDLSIGVSDTAESSTTYTATLANLGANTSYKARFEGVNAKGTVSKADSDDVLYNGTLTIAKGADADESHPETPGTFTVSRADSYGDLVVNYTVGGTAVAGVNYEALSGTVTIPDGSSSATIEVNAIPVYKADTTLTLTLAAGLYNIDAEAASASLAIKAFLPGETYLRKIVFDVSGYAGASTLTDFPVLVRFSSAIAGFSYDDFKNPSTGADLVFTTEAGVPLEYEIDTWNAAGESLVWVKIPSLTAGTKIVAYYGSSEAQSRTAAGTWSSRYLGVWHFNAISGGSTPDATGHGLAMTAKDDSIQVTAADGAVGGALVNASASGGSNGGFLSPAYADQFTNSSFTVSAWYNRLGHAMNGYERYFSSKLSYDATNGFEMENSNGSAEWSSARGSNSGGISVQIPKQNVAGWFMLTLAYDGTTLTAYTNGVASASGTVAAVNHQYGFAVGNNAARNERALWGNIDEVRFAKSCENADWVKAEYDTVTKTNFLTSTKGAEYADTTAVMFDGAATVKQVGSELKVTVKTAADSGDGTIKIVYGTNGAEDIENVVTTTTAAGETYTATLSGFVANKTYAARVIGVSAKGTVTETTCNNFYAGAIAVTAGKDADESSLEPGNFTVSRADTYGDLVVNYTVGGTATADTDYVALSGTVTITNGASSAEIVVTPLVSGGTTVDTTVQLTLAEGAYLIEDATETATIKILNSSTNPLVRYVATTGSDDNDGLTPATAKATIQAAVDDLDSKSTENACTVYVAKGTYTVSGSKSEASVAVTGLVSVVGMTGQAADVTIKSDGTAYSLVRLNNAGAALRYVTLSGGRAGNQGGGVKLQNGVVEDCIITGCKSGGDWGVGGSGIYAAAGRISRCVFTDNTLTTGGSAGAAVYVCSGAIMEDSLVTKTACGSSGAVYVQAGGKVVNCTVANNTGSSRSGILVANTTAVVANCAIFGNVNSDTDVGTVYSPGCGAAYVNCASDSEIEGGVNCVTTAHPRFRDASAGDYLPVVGSPLIDSGSGDDYGMVSTTDLAGNRRVVGTIDIGCYESTKTDSEVSCEWTTSSPLVPATVTLSAASQGLDSPAYAWTLHNENTDVDIAAAGASVSLTTLTPGLYTISVAAGGLSYVSPSQLLLASPVLYVKSGNESAAFPYDTEATASSNIATAVDAAADGSTIRVLAGKYDVTEQIQIDKAISILGVGRNLVEVHNTVSNAAEGRVFYMNNAEALVANLTISGGKVQWGHSGGNIAITANGGTFSNCLITAGWVYSQYNQGSGAAYMSGGMLTHCEITKCGATPNGNGATRVLYMSKGGSTTPTLSNCYIHDCDGSLTDKGVAANSSGSLIYTTGACRIESTTIMDCKTYAGSGLLYVSPDSGLSVVNSAFFGEDATGGVQNVVSGANPGWGVPRWPTRVANCAAPIELTDGTVTGSCCVVTTAAACYTTSAGYPTVKKNGPLYNAGTNVDQTFPSTDFTGRRRVSGGTIDIGCFEGAAGPGLMVYVR